MVCPYCHRFTPDQGFKCINCGAVLSRKDAVAGFDAVAPQGRVDRTFFKPWMLLLLLLLGILAYVFVSHQGRSVAVNAHDPGAELAIENYLLKGKTNIVDFYSDYCPPCKKISPLLQELGSKRPDLAVLKVDINRKGVKGIDWRSPLARQFKLSSIPHFRIYDAEGDLLMEGQEATNEVFRMLLAAGIRM